MRHSTRFFLLVLLTTALASCSQPPVNPLEGTWKLNSITVMEGGNSTNIENPGIGLMIFHGTWYAQVWMESDRLYSDPPTDLEKLHAYEAFDASAGTYTYENARLTLSPQIARDPRAVGRPSATRMVIEGDTMTRTKEQPSPDDPVQTIQWTSVYTRVR
jgi:hypothetical protein